MVKLEEYAGNLQQHLRTWVMLMMSASFPIDKAHMQSKLNNLCYESRKAGLEINFSKT
jgi:hypothetical protein